MLQEKQKNKQLGHPLKIKLVFFFFYLILLWRVQIETVEEGVMREEEESHEMNECDSSLCFLCGTLFVACVL